MTLLMTEAEVSEPAMMIRVESVTASDNCASYELGFVGSPLDSYCRGCVRQYQ
jgi:hypothetical protein